MKAVIYARYSSDGQREESIEGQLRECKAYAEKNGITVLGTYIDRALSAKTDNRPEFQRMVKDSGKLLFDVVIVWKLDRFARNRYDSAHYKAVLRKNGVKVISATEAISDDSTGILLESLLEGYAEFYSAELSEKVIRGLTENALKGKYNGGSVPMGYTVGSDQYFQIDPAAAPVVLEIFKLYENGSTMQEICNVMNAKSIKTPNSKKMRVDTIKTMLKNRKYIGEYRYRDIVTPDAIPAIVPQDLFDRVQEILAKNKKAAARHKAEDDYLLTTKLHCGKDGVFMVGECGTGRGKVTHRYYKCVNAKRNKICDMRAVKKDYIEGKVVKETLEILHDENVVRYLVDAVLELDSNENTNLPLLKKQLEETVKAINNMLNAIQQGVLTSSTKQRLDELEATKSELEVSIIQEQIQALPVTREQLICFIHSFRDSDVTDRVQRQRLIDIFVNSVYVYDDHMKIYFNYKESTKTVSLQDIERSDDGSDIKRFAVPSTSSRLKSGCFLLSLKPPPIEVK